MKILGLDLETANLDKENPILLEIGTATWDNITNIPVFMYSKLISNPIPIENRESTYKINKISDALLAREGWGEEDSVALLQLEIEECDAVCAFNGNNFDKPVLEKVLFKYDKKIYKPWIDPRIDCKVPPKGSLTLWAAELGFVNPFPHRAVTDVLTMFKCITLAGENLEDMYEQSKIPCITIYAAGLSYERRGEASKLGYIWKPEYKSWIKVIKENRLDEECKIATFKVGKL